MSRLTYGLVLLVVVVSGCTGGSAPTAEPTRTSVAPSGPTRTTPTQKPTPAPKLGPVAQRCGLPDVPARRLRLAGPDGSRLSAVEVGSGPVGAVFIHQTGASGLCGFWPYAVWLEQEYGLRSVLLDLCGYGDSRCGAGRFDDDLVAQTAIAVQWLRAHGGERVTLVGASMGGTVATVAGATLEPPVDAVVNLSGPLEWGDLDVVASAPDIRVPALFAVAPYDTVVSVRELRAALQRTGGPQRFMVAPAGHGWQLLGSRVGADYDADAVGRQVAQLIERGSFAGR